MGDDRPSEAMKMYETFVKRLRILDLEQRIPGGIGIPDPEAGATTWTIRIGKQTVSVYLEEDSVDTEDNAEKSGTIIRKILGKRFYDHVAVFPLSSDFHTKRIAEAFRRHLAMGVPTSVRSVSAENVLECAGGKYARYAELKRNSIRPKTKILEILLRVASRFEA